MNEPVDLSSLLAPAAAPEPEISEDEQAAIALMESINLSLDTMRNSMQHLHIENRKLNGRVSQLETFVAYLLSQDPGTAERMKAMSEAAKEPNEPGT